MSDPNLPVTEQSGIILADRYPNSHVQGDLDSPDSKPNRDSRAQTTNKILGVCLIGLLGGVIVAPFLPASQAPTANSAPASSLDKAPIPAALIAPPQGMDQTSTPAASVSPNSPTAPNPNLVKPSELTKVQMEDTINVALLTGEVGSIKYVTTASYFSNDVKQASIDQIAIANAIQDNLAQISSHQLATQSLLVRRRISTQLPKSITSLNLQPSKELLEGYRRLQKAAQSSIVSPVVKPSTSPQPKSVKK